MYDFLYSVNFLFENKCPKEEKIFGKRKQKVCISSWNKGLFVFHVGGYFINLHRKHRQLDNFTLPDLNLKALAAQLSFFYKFIPQSNAAQMIQVTVCGNAIFNHSRRGAIDWTWTGNIEFFCNGTNSEVCWIRWLYNFLSVRNASLRMDQRFQKFRRKWQPTQFMWLVRVEIIIEN